MKSLRKNKKYKKQKTLKLRTLYGGQDTPIESENTKTFVTAQEGKEEPPVVTAQEGKEEPPVVTAQEGKEEPPVVTEEGKEEQPVTEEGKEEQPVTEEGTEEQPVTEEGTGEQPVTEEGTGEGIGKDEEADDNKYIIQTDTEEQPQEEVSEELKEDYDNVVPGETVENNEQKPLPNPDEIVVKLDKKTLENLAVNLNTNILINIAAYSNVLQKLIENETNADKKSKLQETLDSLNNIQNPVSKIFDDVQKNMDVENPLNAEEVIAEATGSGSTTFMQKILGAEAAAILGSMTAAAVLMAGGSKKRKTKRRNSNKRNKGKKTKYSRK
jgi:hypothetical protein